MVVGITFFTWARISSRRACCPLSFGFAFLSYSACWNDASKVNMKAFGLQVWQTSMSLPNTFIPVCHGRPCRTCFLCSLPWLIWILLCVGNLKFRLGWGRHLMGRSVTYGVTLMSKPQVDTIIAAFIWATLQMENIIQLIYGGLPIFKLAEGYRSAELAIAS